MQYTKDVVIGDRRFTIQHFMPTKGLKVLTRLTKLVGKPLAEMAGGANKDATEMLPKAVESLIERLDEDSVENLVKDLCYSAFLNGQPITSQTFETEFQGRMKDIFELCIAVVDHNFSDFLSGILAKQSRPVAKKKTA